MFKPWITVPAEDIRIQLPMNMSDTEIKIMFRDAEVVDKTIEQLKKLKWLLNNSVLHFD